MKLNKSSSFIASILIMMVSFMLPISAYAANPSYTLNVNYDTTSCTATINGGTGIINSYVTQGDNVSITVNNQSTVPLGVVFAFTGGTGSYGKTLYPNGTAHIPPPAIGDTYSTTVPDLQNNVSVNVSDNNGCGSNNSPYGVVSESITANPPVPVVSPTTTSSTSTTSTSSKTANSDSTPTTTSSDGTTASATSPSLVQLTAVDVAGKAVSTTKTIELNQTQALKLTGHTTANGLVTLTIHSKPKTVMTTADANGNWAYIVTGLRPGSHSIEATVTDPATKQVSAATKLVSFKIDAQTAQVAKPSSNKGEFIVGGVVVALAIAAGLAFVLMKKRAYSSSKKAGENKPIKPISDTTDISPEADSTKTK